MSANYYEGKATSPYHLSVGVVLMNANHEVACHYFSEFHGMKDSYILMRETMEPGESLEQAAERGLKEEFGATGVLKGYLGSLVSSYPRNDKEIKKTTLYFLFELRELREEWRKVDDEERDSEKRWEPIAKLKAAMQEQSKRISRTDIDESEILERVDA